MPEFEKHVITFDAGAKKALQEASGLPDLNSVSDDNGLTDICMFFGAAAYYAQFFEAAIAEFLTAYIRLSKTGVIETGIKVDEETLDKNTMGLLLKKLRTHFEIDKEIDGVLLEALTKRNYLMHHFFQHHDSDFPSAEKRPEIIRELIEVGLLFKKAMFAMRGMTAGIERVLKDSVM